MGSRWRWCTKRIGGCKRTLIILKQRLGRQWKLAVLLNYHKGLACMKHTIPLWQGTVQLANSPHGNGESNKHAIKSSKSSTIHMHEACFTKNNNTNFSFTNHFYKERHHV